MHMCVYVFENEFLNIKKQHLKKIGKIKLKKKRLSPLCWSVQVFLHKEGRGGERKVRNQGGREREGERERAR